MRAGLLFDIFPVILGLLGGLADAGGITFSPPSDSGQGFKTLLNIHNLEHVAPGLKDNCKGAEFPEECHTSKEAYPLIVAGFKKYRITHPAVQAAVVANMAYESGDFQYNKKHYPEELPGWGTKDMQSSTNNQAYATYLGIKPSQWNEDLNKLVELVGADNYTFASAMWYIKHKCDRPVRRKLWNSTAALEDEAFEAYVRRCLFVSGDISDRQLKWQKAAQVLIPTPGRPTANTGGSVIWGQTTP